MIMTGRYLLNRYCPCIILHGCHWMFNTLQPRHNGRYFPDDIFICIFLNENVWISIKISLTYVPWGRMNDIPALVQIMAWRLLGDKPLSEPMLVSLPMHISVTQPQWVKHWFSSLWLCRVILCLLGSEKKKNRQIICFSWSIIHQCIMSWQHYVASRNWGHISSGNGLSHSTYQAIIWTRTGLLLVGLLETNFSPTWMKIKQFSNKIMTVFAKLHQHISFCRC